MALVVEAETVDHGLVGYQPEDAGLRVAGLRFRRDRTDLGKAETEADQRCWHLGILVVAGRHAERVGEFEAGDHLAQAWIGACVAGRDQTALQGRDGKAMRGFWIKQKK